MHVYSSVHVCVCSRTHLGRLAMLDIKKKVYQIFTRNKRIQDVFQRKGYVKTYMAKSNTRENV